GDGLVTMAASGALTNTRKGIDAGLNGQGEFMGGPRLRTLAPRNEHHELRCTEDTNNVHLLPGLNRSPCNHTVIERDLTGQINTELAGGGYIGAIGGVNDFLRGAQASQDGTPIIALPSMARDHSRIVAALSGPATVPRSCSCVIVTEHGVADLRGLTLSQR